MVIKTDRGMFGAPTVVTIKIPVLWVVTPCGLVNVYWRFRRTCRLCRQENINGITPQSVMCILNRFGRKRNSS